MKKNTSNHKTLSNFKPHFAEKMKEYRENNKFTSETEGCQVANDSSQTLLEAKNDAKDFTSQIIEEI